MSTASFTNKVIDDMYDRMGLMNTPIINNYLKFDETFELALALVYMTLSKEKIIKKEIKNPDALGRLERRVPKREIDNLFIGKYANMIKYTEVDDSTWILDAIRDSIIHHKADIDEARKLVLVNNDYENRKLIAEIPFDWFKDYIKTDIVNKKVTNRYNFRNFYASDYISSKRPINTRNISSRLILYNVHIEDENIPLKETDEFIKSLMEKYSKVEIDNSASNKYYASFVNAVSELYKELNNKFPNATNIRISIIKKRDKINKKINSKLANNYKDPDKLFEDLNSLVFKNKDLLDTISSIYSFVASSDKNNISNDEIIKLLEMINGKSGSYSIKDYYKETKDIYMMFLQMYGLITIVLNEENLKNSDYLNILDSHLKSYTKGALDEFQIARRNNIKQMLNAEISYKKHLKNYNNVGDSNEIIKNSFEKAQEKYYTALSENAKFNYWPDFIVTSRESKSEVNTVRDILFTILRHKYDEFTAAETKDEIIIKKKEVLAALDKLSAYEKKNILTVTKPSDTLVFLRNCLAHNNRIHCSDVAPLFIMIQKLTLTDFNDNGELTGIGFCKYTDIIDLISAVKDYTEEKGKTLIKK